MRRIDSLVSVTTRYQRSPDSSLRGILEKTCKGFGERKTGRGLDLARIVGEELLIPYSFDLPTKLDSHFYNVTVADNLILARFSWFETDIAGYIMLKMESPDRLLGGWWWDEEGISRRMPPIPQSPCRVWWLRFRSCIQSS